MCFEFVVSGSEKDRHETPGKAIPRDALEQSYGICLEPLWVSFLAAGYEAGNRTTTIAESHRRCSDGYYGW